jgi:Transposase, Mutator family
MCSAFGCKHPKARSFGPGVLAELRNRGVEDVLIACVGGLTGFPEAIEATWPNTVVKPHLFTLGLAVHIGAGGSHWGWRDGPAGHLHRPGRDLQPVAFEVQMQTCQAGVVAGLSSASGSSADLSAEMRYRRGQPTRGWQRPEGGPHGTRSRSSRR